MAGEIHCKLHAIMIPLPFQGHMNPMVNLALKLASKGVTVTFAHLEFVHHKLSEARDSTASQLDIFSEAWKSGLDIRYTTISDGLPLEFDRSANRAEYWWVLYRDFPARVDKFVEESIKMNPSMVPFIVADTCSAWLASIAHKYNLVSVSFWTEPAHVFSLVYHSQLKEHGHFPCKDGIEEDISYLPGEESINTRDLMPYLKESEYEGTVCETLLMAFEEVKKVDFILHNTVQELEAGTLSALNNVQRTYAIGPVISPSTLSANVTKSLLPETDCTYWLNSKPPGSVLYVSFGSIVDINKHDVQEIANGLLLSEVNFIWVMHGDSNVLPIGFEDEIEDKGLVIPWCDQITSLSNAAVGGFLTHCGWNSVLESIWCGVPMICYPITYEQPTNRKLVVDDWKVGIDLCDGTAVQRQKVADKIRNFMHQSSSEGLEQGIKRIRAILHDATEIGGSSDCNLNNFISDLKAKLCTMTVNNN